MEQQNAAAIGRMTSSMNGSSPEVMMTRKHSFDNPLYVEELARSIRASADKVENEINALVNVADEGSVEGMFLLGELYLSGYGVIPKDEEVAYKWLKMAYHEKHDKAMEKIHDLFVFGNIPISLLVKAAMDDNLPEAQFELGTRYLSGNGVTKDEQKGAALFSMAAQQGHTGALSSLGECYLNGIGVLKDKKMATFWYRKAVSEGGHSWDKEKLHYMTAKYSVAAIFRWKIPNLLKSSQILEFVSDNFTAHGQDWKLSFHPKGEFHNSSQASVFLHLSNPSSVSSDWSTIVHFTLTLVNQKDQKRSREMQGFSKFTKSNYKFGVKNHTSFSAVCDSNEGFLEGDVLELEAKVRVEASKS